MYLLYIYITQYNTLIHIIQINFQYGVTTGPDVGRYIRYSYPDRIDRIRTHTHHHNCGIVGKFCVPVFGTFGLNLKIIEVGCPVFQQTHVVHVAAGARPARPLYKPLSQP